MTVQCFTLVPLPRARRVFRRSQMLRRGYLCLAVAPLLGHPIYRHEAAHVGDPEPRPLSAVDRILMPPDAGWPEDLPWPKLCANPGCPEPGGYAFQPDDIKTVLMDRLYGRADGSPGEYVLSGALPPGAVYDVAPWVPPGPDGRSLVLVLPDGKPLYLDAPNPGGEHFERSAPGGLLSVRQTAGDALPWRVEAGEIRPA